MKIILLGATGFLGKNIINKLKNTNHEIIGASRTLGIDLRDKEVWCQFLSEHNPDAIINCAAHVGSLHYVTEYAGDVVHDNILMSVNIYEAVTKICPNTIIINPLSNCSYPGVANIHFESDWWQGEVHDSVFAYANSKRFIYVIGKSYNKQYGIKSVNFLVPNTFGPGDSTDPNKTHALNGMIIRMIKAQRKKNKIFEIWGTGKPVREWAYIDDVVKILIEGLTTNSDLIFPVNIAQNKGFSIKESAQLIAEAVDYNGKLEFNTTYQDGAPIKILDDKFFRDLFPNYSFTNHAEGIKNTVKYYKKILKD